MVRLRVPFIFLIIDYVPFFACRKWGTGENDDKIADVIKDFVAKKGKGAKGGAGWSVFTPVPTDCRLTAFVEEHCKIHLKEINFSDCGGGESLPTQSAAEEHSMAAAPEPSAAGQQANKPPEDPFQSDEEDADEVDEDDENRSLLAKRKRNQAALKEGGEEGTRKKPAADASGSNVCPSGSASSDDETDSENEVNEVKEREIYPGFFLHRSAVQEKWKKILNVSDLPCHVGDVDDFDTRPELFPYWVELHSEELNMVDAEDDMENGPLFKALSDSEYDAILDLHCLLNYEYQKKSKDKCELLFDLESKEETTDPSLTPSAAQKKLSCARKTAEIRQIEKFLQEMRESFKSNLLTPSKIAEVFTPSKIAEVFKNGKELEHENACETLKAAGGAVGPLLKEALLRKTKKLRIQVR